jgi:hypothetical protein
MAKDHGPQVKDDEQYQALRRQGASKEKAARIANTGRRQAGLYQRAKEIGIEGRSGMTKGELIGAIRNH